MPDPATDARPDALWYPGRWAREVPDRPAIVHADTGEAITYAQLHADAVRIARVLRERGLEPGDHVAWCLENRLEHLVVTWGARYAGLVATAISYQLTAAEIAYIVDDCGARAFVASPATGERATEVIEATPGVEVRLSVGGDVEGHERLEPLLEGVSPEEPDGLVAGTDMLYSSGTTGRPKGVAMPFRDVPLGTDPERLESCRRNYGFVDDFTYLNPAPLYHAAPQRFCVRAHRGGGTVVVMPRFDAERALAAIERFRVTTGQWVPTMFVRMLQLPAEVRERYDVSSLTHAIHAAAPIAIPTKRAMIDWWGPILHEYYSGTERAGATYVDSHDWLERPGTVGRASEGVIHIVGEDGEELPVGEEGAVYFESAGDFEYHGDPEKTAAARHPKGWTTMGDIGRVDEDGYLFLTDRKAFTIITGGVNVYPQEAEDVLIVHPEVIDAAVFGIPNDDFGEEVKAVVQPAEWPADDEAAEALERRLIDACRAQLAAVKCPRSVDFRRELPRHPTGKLYKRLLRDEYRAAHDA